MFHQFLASDMKGKGTVISNLSGARLILCQQCIAEICSYEISKGYCVSHLFNLILGLRVEVKADWDGENLQFIT